MDHRGVAGLVGLVWYFVLRFGQATDSGEAARAQIAVEDAKEHAERAAAAERVVHADLARSWAPTTASNVEVMPEGKTFYPRMLADIKGATSSIHIMQYGFNPGVIGDQFTPVLEQKARDGVKVRIILDALGSHAWFGTKTMLSSLAAAGVEVMLHDAVPPDRRGPVGQRRWSLAANQFGRVEHRKSSSLMARPRTSAAPIEDHFADGRFHDVYIRFTGPVTRQLQAIFVDSFRYHGGTLRPARGRSMPSSAGPGPGAHRVTVLMNWPRGWRPYTETAFRLVREAASRLDMTNPYIGDPRMIADIIDAPPARRRSACRLVVSTTRTAASRPPRSSTTTTRCSTPGSRSGNTRPSSTPRSSSPTIGRWSAPSTSTRGRCTATRSLALFEDASVADQFRTVMIDPDVVVSKAGEPPTGGFRRAKNRILARASDLF